MRKILRLLLASSSFWICGAASAASFDCTHAAADTEKLICGNAALSTLDTDLETKYGAVLRKLSPTGVQIVTAGQREWVQLVRRSCASSDVFGKHLFDDRALCLVKLYRARIKQLDASALQAGPFLFSRIDHFQIATGTDPNGGPRLATDQRSLPRIDHPVNELTSKLNALLARKDMIPECGVHPDRTADGAGVDDYEVTFASRKIISVTWQYWSYCFGAAHGQGGSFSQNLVLDANPRPLRPSDLFAGGDLWKEILTNLSEAAVKRELAKEDGEGRNAKDLPAETLTAIASFVTNPETWSLRADGLEIRFGPYELDMGYPGTATILIPWSDLRRVMLANAP